MVKQVMIGNGYKWHVLWSFGDEEATAICGERGRIGGEKHIALADARSDPRTCRRCLRGVCAYLRDEPPTPSA